MLTHCKHSTDHDLTELSWLTQSDIFEQQQQQQQSKIDKHRRYSPPVSFHDTSDSEHDNDTSSLNSSSERVTSTTDSLVTPPHSALCFWIFFAIEDSKTRALTLNEICEWIEHHIEQSISSNDDHSIQSARLKSKIRYHMTKQISFFIKITKHPLNGKKLRYPLWTTDRSKRLLLLDTLLTMNTRQLSLYTQYTIDIYERLCSERRAQSHSNTNDENSCPASLIKRDKTIHRLGSTEDSNKRKKQRSKTDSSTMSTIPSVEVVDAAMTLLLLRQTK